MAITYNNLYMDIRQQFNLAGLPAATLEARELVCFAAGKTREQLQADGRLYVPQDVEVVIIRMRYVTFIDQSGLYAMETAIKDLQEKGVEVLMTIIQPQPMYMLTKMNVIPAIVPEEHTFPTFEDCTVYLEQKFNLSRNKN